MDEYGSKIWKVSRWRPAVSSETTLTATQEFFFTNVAPMQRITEIVLLDMFIKKGHLCDISNFAKN